MIAKILLTLAVVLGAYYAFRHFSPRQEGRLSRVQKAAQDAVRRKSGQTADKAQDLIQCPKCGAYHARDTDHDCTA